MTNGQEKTTQALWYAIQMEIDGKVFYLKASRDSSSELGKKLLELLAIQEDYHRQKFEQIYENIRKVSEWPVVDYKSDGGKDFYETIAGEEREHKLVLLDYYEYMHDPAGWYVKAEHHSLDG